MRTLRNFLFLPALALWLTSSARRQVEDANADWLFSYKEATAKPVKGISPQAQVGYDDVGWKSVSVPHTWQTYETTGELHPLRRVAQHHSGTRISQTRLWDKIRIPAGTIVRALPRKIMKSITR